MNVSPVVRILTSVFKCGTSLGEACTSGKAIKKTDLWASVPRPWFRGEEVHVLAHFSQCGSSMWEHGACGQ